MMPMTTATARPDFRGISIKKQGIILASEFLAQHNLTPGPVTRIENLTELVDADVLIVDLPDGVDALTVRDPATGNVVIGVATSTVPYRQNFTLAHEVGHIFAGDLARESHTNFCLPKGPNEQRADSFAAHVLCPVEGLQSHGFDHPPATPEALSDIVREYKVSPRVAATQMRRAGLITSAECSTLAQWSAPKLASRFGWRDSYDDDVHKASQPHPAPRLAADATQAYLEGKVSAGAVALARGISINQVRDELDSLLPVEQVDHEVDPFEALNDFFGES